MEELRGFPGHRDDEQMAARHHFEPGIRYEPGQDLPVHHRHDRIVVAHDDEGRLAQGVQPQETRPTRHGQQLVEIAEIRGPLHVFRVHIE